MNCAVIGSGIAGLATAIRLKSRGFNVNVFEANEYPGGKLTEKHGNGYRFDLGPSVFTMPHLIDELFLLAGKDPRAYFSYTKLDISFKYFFEGGKCITAFADRQKFAKEIVENTIDSEESLLRYLEDIAAKYNITNEVFSENSLHIADNYLKKRVLSGIFNFHKIGAFSSMHEGNKRFFKDPNVIQLFDYYASYVGSNPLVAPATLNLISHLVLNIGTCMPDKGMYSIVMGLVKLAEDIGVRFNYNSLVEEILVKDHIAIGIKVKGRVLPFERVISNMDVYYTYERLLPKEKKPTLVLNQPKSSSVIAFYWGVKGTHPELDIHNMLFTKDEKAEYTTVFDGGNISNDPSVYLCITSKHVQSDAPAGCENWFALVTAPNDQAQDWEEIISRTRRNVISKVNRMLSVDIEPLIEFEEVLSPPLIKQRYASAFGAIFGNSANSKLSAFLRHPNFSRRIKGLYFAGGTVHPGAGIPMCLNSAKIIDKVFR